MVAKVKRSEFKTFLNTNTPGSPTWVLLGDGVTAGGIEYNPKTTEETYISEDSGSTSVDSYAPNFPVEASAKKGDSAFDFMDALRKSRGVGALAEAEIVNVWLYKSPGPALGFYPAEKQAVSLQMEKFGGDGGVAAKINYTINFIGEQTIGGFHPSATIEFLPLPVTCILTTMVIGAVTFTPLFATDHSWLWYAGSVPNGTTVVSMTSTLAGATIVQKDNVDAVVGQGGDATLTVGVNHLKIEVTVGAETVIYKIDITRAAA
jgi:hypothetical protein